MAEKRPLEIASQAIDSLEREEDPDPTPGGGGAWLDAHSTVKGATRLAFAALAALENAGFRIVEKDDPRLAAPMAVATNVDLRVSAARRGRRGPTFTYSSLGGRKGGGRVIP